MHTSDIFGLKGTLVIPKAEQRQFIDEFSEFLKSKHVEFTGDIGSKFIKIGKEVPKIPIDSLKLSQRVKKILYREEIFDLGTLSTYYEEDITNFRGLGEGAYQELLGVLEEHGIHPISYMNETTDFKYFCHFERKELHMNNIRTLKELYALSDAEFAQKFHVGTRLYKKLRNKRKEYFSSHGTNSENDNQ